MRESEITRKLKAFTSWLTGCGAEVLVPTNQYEVVRFRGNRGTSIIYRKETGALTFTGEALQAWDAFRSATPWKANPPAKRRQGGNITVKALRERDGNLCFFCQEPLPENPSIEHLVPVASRGPSHISNYALAHAHCNSRAGHISVMDKVRIHVAAVLRKREAKR